MAGTPPSGPLRLGAVVGIFLLAGFTVGEHLGVPAWAVVAVAVVALVARARSFPMRSVPLGAAVLVCALAVLAAGAADHLGIDTVVGGQGPLAQVRAAAAAALGANLVNNLPALLVALPALEAGHPDQVWAVLVGVNIGPVVLVGGSLSTLLWLSTMRQLGVEVSARTFGAIGLRIGVPAFGAAVAVRVVVSLA